MIIKNEIWKKKKKKERGGKVHYLQDSPQTHYPELKWLTTWYWDYVILKHLGQPLNDIRVSADTHDRNTWHLADPPLQIRIICRHNITLMLHYALNNTVIRVRALVATCETLNPRIAGQPQRNAKLRAQLFELSHNTVCNHRNTLGVQAVHHATHKVKFFLNAKVEKVGINNDLIWRLDGLVVLKEKRRWYLWPMTD